MTDDNDSKTPRGKKIAVLSTTSSLGEKKKTNPDGSQVDTGAAASFSLTTAKGTKFDVKTLRDVVNEVPPEREWTVDGIAPDSGLGIIGGRHKRGKSTLGMHLSRSVEAGRAFSRQRNEKSSCGLRKL